MPEIPILSPALSAIIGVVENMFDAAKPEATIKGKISAAADKAIDSLAEPLANARWRPDADFKELAAKAPDALTKDEREQYRILDRQVDKQSRGKNLSVATERTVRSGIDMVGEVADGALEPAKKYGDQIIAFAKKHPVAAIGVGAFIGLGGAVTGGFIGKVAGWFSLPFGSSITAFAGAVVGAGVGTAIAWPLIKAGVGDTSSLEKMLGVADKVKGVDLDRLKTKDGAFPSTALPEKHAFVSASSKKSVASTSVSPSGKESDTFQTASSTVAIIATASGKKTAADNAMAARIGTGPGIADGYSSKKPPLATPGSFVELTRGKSADKGETAGIGGR